MKKIVLLAVLLAALMGAALPQAGAEGVKVRLYFTYFDGAAITTETTAPEYHDFENVDPNASIYNFQEYYLKQQFPELTSYGTSQETVLAYTDTAWGLYDGIYTTISQLVNPNIEMAELCLWLGTTYMHVSNSMIGDESAEAVFYDFLDESSYGLLLPENMTKPSVDGIIATVAPLTQVFLNGRSVALRVKGDSGFLMFTEAVTQEDADTIRLTLKAEEADKNVSLVYTESALQYLSTINIAEICLIVGDKTEITPLDAL